MIKNNLGSTAIIKAYSKTSLKFCSLMIKNHLKFPHQLRNKSVLRIVVFPAYWMQSAFTFETTRLLPSYNEGLYWEKIYFHFHSHWIGYDRGDSFLFDFKLNRFPFGSKSKLSVRSYPIQFERKSKYSFPSAEHLMRVLKHVRYSDVRA